MPNEGGMCLSDDQACKNWAVETLWMCYHRLKLFVLESEIPAVSVKFSGCNGLSCVPAPRCKLFAFRVFLGDADHFVVLVLAAKEFVIDFAQQRNLAIQNVPLLRLVGI